MNNMKKVFAKNLKNFRLAMGLTQAELGEKINYSEKSISKWESGGAIPGVEVLLNLANALQTDMNSLLYENVEERYYLGIDGGATGTNFALADGKLNVIRTLKLSSTNAFDVGMEKAQQTLDTGIREILNGIPFNKICLFAGISGAESGNNLYEFNKFFSRYGFLKFDCKSDTANAIQLGLNGENGIVAIMGTGSVVCVVNNGEVSTVGGHGALFDKGCSGYDISRSAIYHAFLVEDGVREKDILSTLIFEKAGGSLRSKTKEFYANGRTYIASFAPVVFKAAQLGDKQANEIIKSSATALKNMIKKAALRLPKEDRKAVFVGGITVYKEQLLPYFQYDNALNLSFDICKHHQIDGALQLAKKLEEM